MAPTSVFDAPSSMIQAQPLRLAWILHIQLIKRSPWALFGASGQLEKRVTSGFDNSARNGSVSSICGARSRRRSVVRDGKSWLVGIADANHVQSEPRSGSRDWISEKT